MFSNIKRNIKKFIKSFPGVRTLFRILNEIREQLEDLSAENQILANENIDLRLKLKKINHEKVNVVFVCHRPAVWESLHSVYDALASDPRFCVTIVAIPNKKQLPQRGLNHEEYESEGAEKFWEAYGCRNGYNYETHEWMDLKTLEPDYVFFQQPYNSTRCSQYKSWVVSKYAKLVFVPYGIQVVGGYILDEVYQMDFMRNVSILAATDRYSCRDLKKKLSSDPWNMTRVIDIGCPRTDWAREPMPDDSALWRYHGEHRKFRILWTPRWSTNEGTCSFFEYKEHILQYAAENDDVEIAFRPHPQAFFEWNCTGEMTLEQQKKFRERCQKCGVLIDESGNYLEVLRTADCFLTDITSLMAEFCLTEKPIIYCHKKDLFTELGDRLAEGYYRTTNWEEVEKTIDMLKNHEDPLLQTRLDILDREMHLSDKPVGTAIKDILLQDALK